MTGDNAIRLAYLCHEIEIIANKQSAGKGPAEELVIASYPENQTPPVIVQIPIIHRIIVESYWRIIYTGAPVVSGSRTLQMQWSNVNVEVPKNRSIQWILEKHLYRDHDGDHDQTVMNLERGDFLPPITDFRKYYQSSSHIFLKPNNGLQGIARLDSMAFDENGVGVQPINIANEEVDIALE